MQNRSMQNRSRPDSMLATVLIAAAGTCVQAEDLGAPWGLGLDHNRVAFFGNSAASILDQAAFDAVLPGAVAQPVGIPGWALAPTDGPIADVGEAALIGQDLVDAGGASFVSPVFVGLDGGPVFPAPEFFVAFDESVTPERAEQLLADSGLILSSSYAGLPNTYQVRPNTTNGAEVMRMAARLLDQEGVLFAEPEMIFTGRSSIVPSDPRNGDAWQLENTLGPDMDAYNGFDVTLGSPSIITLVLDTGVDLGHEDLVLAPGIDTTSDPGIGQAFNSCDSHGTPVAGVIGAVADNGLGLTGIAPGTRVASARAFISTASCDGSWTSASSWTVNALAHAENIGARVTNNSNGYGFTSSLIESKYQTTRDAGMVHFASAGNNSSSSVTYPSSLPTVNAVSAISSSGSKAGFSNFGSSIAFSAPGAGVLSTDRTGSPGYTFSDYVFVSGTSFASPLTAGVAAMVLSVDPTLSADEVEDILEASALDLGLPGTDDIYGRGFVQLAAAVRLAQPCRADLTTSNVNPGEPGYASPDGVVDGADLALFVESWLARRIDIGDVNTSNVNPGEPGYGLPDGEVGGADLSWWIELWLTGCPIPCTD